MSLKRLKAQEEEYQMRFGGLPKEREALLEYVKRKYPFSEANMDKALDIYEQLTWETQKFTLFIIPRPTPRPRTDGNHFYVKGAAENKLLIKKYIEKHIVATRCEVEMRAYLPTPLTQMNHAEIYLAEAGLIRPIHTADVDNIMKTYLDMITGHLILNDNLVSAGFLEKFFSVRPRLDIELRYQIGYDSHYNEKRITSSKSFRETMAQLKTTLSTDS